MAPVRLQPAMGIWGCKNWAKQQPEEKVSTEGVTEGIFLHFLDSV